MFGFGIIGTGILLGVFYIFSGLKIIREYERV